MAEDWRNALGRHGGNVPVPHIDRPEPQFGTFDNRTGERVPDWEPPTWGQWALNGLSRELSHYDPRNLYRVPRAMWREYQAVQRERELHELSERWQGPY